MKPDEARRSLLRFLLASPLVSPSLSIGSMQALLGCAKEVSSSVSDDAALRRLAREAITVFDFEEVARRRLSAAHWTYLSMGVEHEVTLRANRSAFDRFQLRPRRLVDTRALDTSLEVFGQKMTSPICIAPCGAQRAFHPDGELAVARAARRRDQVQILSTGSSTAFEDVIDARGGPVWFQLYTPRIFALTKLQLREAEAKGSPVVILTVDQVGVGANRDRLQAFRRRTNPDCRSCHGSFSEDFLSGASRGLNAVGIDTREWLRNMMTLDWDIVDRIRDATNMKLVIKGILTAEDAELCIEHGVDGLIVSNHGGRAEDSGLSTIEVLPEIVNAVEGRIPVLVDSGFRRGTDVFKALALGASAVLVGRPYLWGLAALGQEGVESVLDIIDQEFRQIMAEMGTPTLAEISQSHVRAAPSIGESTNG